MVVHTHKCTNTHWPCMVVSGRGINVEMISMVNNERLNNLFPFSLLPTFLLVFILFITLSYFDPFHFSPAPLPIVSNVSFPIHPPAQKGLLHLSPDVYQEMEASRKQAGSAPGPCGNSGGSVNYMTPKDTCSAPLPPGHPPYYSGSASSPTPTATMARELLLNGQSPTADNAVSMKGKNPALACGVSVQPAQQLDYLARIQGFQVR